MSEIETHFAYGNQSFPNTKPVANIFAFCALMASVVASKRGGQNSDYISECAHFMVDVIGRPLSVSDALPDDFDWTPMSAIECANALMEYDG